MVLYARNVVSEKTTLLDLSDAPTQEEFETVMQQLSDTQHAGPFIILTEKNPADVKSTAPAKEPGETERLSSLDNIVSNLPTPTPPKPQSPTNFPPDRSEELIVSTNPVSGLYVALGNTYFPVDDPIFNGGLQPPFPQNVYAQLSTYWEKAGTATIVGPQTYTHEVSFEAGMTVTDSTTLSAELGVSIGKLSAKIAATTSHSVTTSQSRTVTDSYELKVGDSETAVYVLWQLIAKIRFVDADNNPIEWAGILKTPIANFKVTFPNERRLSMFNTVYSDRTDFKT